MTVICQLRYMSYLFSEDSAYSDHGEVEPIYSNNNY